MTEKVWREKIQKDHPEFSGKEEYRNEVGRAIESPEYVVAGWSGELLALIYSELAPERPKYLCVIYRELNGDGFVITTFFISKVQKLLRRGIVWSRQK